MTLSTAYIIVGAVFCILGICAILGGANLVPALLRLPRSRIAAMILWSGALAWFLFHVWTLDEVDLAGFPRTLVIAVFGGAGLLAFKFLADLLPLRALAVLVIFSSNELLHAGFNQLPYSRVLAGTAYLLIIGALWVGASPYVLRNAIARVCAKGKRIRITGLVFMLIGIANLTALYFVK